MPNIFISHNSKDKAIVEPIAIRLAKIFGQDNVFYDSWSIQPGDGIIDKMNSGLFQCDYFFVFVSKNSLQSKMVQLEWQNALLKATDGLVKLIPVKLDDCLMPAILMQTLYIDIFGKGLEYGFRQMVDVINGKNVFQGEYQTYENIRARIHRGEYSYKIDIAAQMYFEPMARFLILIDCQPEDVNVNCTSDSARMTGSQSDITLNNGFKCNALYESVSRGVSPGFPYSVEISHKEKRPFQCFGVMRAITDSEYRIIPTELV